MTVKEFKEKLKDLNDDDEIMVLDSEYGDSHIEKLTRYEDHPLSSSKAILLIEPKETSD